MSYKSKFSIRQVHLDFHTSPDMKGIGSKFSKENFQTALKEGNLDSITVFAKCHHSMCYYPTKVGIMHPGLDFDLTGAMVDAAHEIGVRAPVYITAGWSDEDAKAHPEWIMVDKEGNKRGSIDYSNVTDWDAEKPQVQWNTLCLADGGGYAQHIYELTEEVCQRYKDLDGLFYDICAIGEACYCESCVKGMNAEGIDLDDEEAVKDYLIRKRQVFFKKCGDILKKYHPDATIFFNGCAHQYKTAYHEYQTHFEMEDLPTAWGGYDKLPMRAKYFGKKGNGVIGMTGKFHLSWGEFGGFKTQNALKYEIATMALYGAGCSVGDHMHPDGEMEMQTYEDVGYAYKYLEKIAPYCYEGETCANIGIYTSPVRDANEGVSNILLENQLDYDLVTDNNFNKFDTVIVSEKAVMDDEALAAFKNYIASGGKAIVMADALLKDGKFQLDMGVSYIGEPEFDCDYLVTNNKNAGVPNAPMLCYYPAVRVKADETAETHAEFLTPYFKRTFAHFCGHKNTPHEKNSKKYPAIVKKGNVVYIAHALPRTYLTYGSVFHKRYFMMALGLVYGGSQLKVEGLGAQGRCTMINQPKESRYCINMAYASPVRRGKAEIIEDVMPIYNIKAEVKTDKTVKRVYLPLQEKELKFTVGKGRVSFVLPELTCHETIVIEY